MDFWEALASQPEALTRSQRAVQAQLERLDPARWPSGRTIVVGLGASYLSREEEFLHRDRDEPVTEPASSAPRPAHLADDGYAGELARVLSAWGRVPESEGLILDFLLGLSRFRTPLGGLGFE
jgi:hypothetical protein